MNLTALETMAIAFAALALGYGLRARVRLLGRLNFPAPVIGGLVAALAVMACKSAGAPVTFDVALQSPMMIAFFTSIGFAASLQLLRRGGPQVVLLLGFCTLVAIAQGLLGAGIATAFGLPPLAGVLAGTVTLSGGPATGLAFAPQFEAAGVAGASAIATATAMAGITLAGIFGAPLATLLIARHRLDPRLSPEAAQAPVDSASPRRAVTLDLSNPAAQAFAALKVIGLIVVCMWLGGWVSSVLKSAGATLPAYVGAMIVAGVARNFDDATGLLKLPIAAFELAGSVALALFLVLAMMNLDLTLLAGLALPLVVNLAAQLALVAALTLGPVWWLMGRDYDGAVAAGGFAGFMLGITANAVAIMSALVERYGPAPRAFLAVPLVGAFFIDFTNAVIATVFLHILG